MPADVPQTFQIKCVPTALIILPLLNAQIIARESVNKAKPSQTWYSQGEHDLDRVVAVSGNWNIYRMFHQGFITFRVVSQNGS